MSVKLGHGQGLLSLIETGYPVAHLHTILNYARALNADMEIVKAALVEALPALRTANRHTLADEIEEQIMKAA